MPGMDLTGEWKEAKSGLGMDDGESYIVEFHGDPGTRILALDVLGNDRPDSDDDALVHFNRDQNPQAEPALEFEARSGWTWWLKATRGTSRVVSARI